MNRKTELLMTIALLASVIFLSKEGALFVQNHLLKESDNEPPLSTMEDTSTTESPELSAFCIVIDAGHGGTDPGKVGVNNILEKDINLAIALQLAEKLQSGGISTVLTRDSDIDLSNGAANFKSADMQNRCKIITDANPIFTISIHQNSYPSENVTGAQVFYFTHSAEGKELATTLQDSLIANVDPNNRRQPKANDSYYLLKKTPTPTVIVECGFLSSPSEATLLCTPEYQEKMVHAIYLGILAHLEAKDYL